MTTNFKTTLAAGLLAALLTAPAMAHEPLGQDQALRTLGAWNGQMGTAGGDGWTIYLPTREDAQRVAANGNDGYDGGDRGQHDPVYRPRKDGSAYDRAFMFMPIGGQDAKDAGRSPYGDHDEFYWQGM